MAIKFAEIAKRSGIGGIHAAGLAIQALGFFVLLVHLGYKAALHDRFDPGAFCGIQNRRIKKFHGGVHAELFQFFRGVFGLAGEETFFLEHGAIKRNGAILVAGLSLLFRGFKLLLDGLFALLHFRFDQLFDRVDFEESVVVLDLVDNGAVGFGEDNHRKFLAGEELLAQGGTGISDAHGDTLGSIEREAPRVAQARALKLLSGGRKPIHDESARARSLVRFHQFPRDLVDLLVAHAAAGAAASHASRAPSTPTAAGGPIWNGQQQKCHRNCNQAGNLSSHYNLLSFTRKLIVNSAWPSHLRSRNLSGYDALLG